MGASSWLAITSHQGSLAECLQAAKRSVFADQNFIDIYGIIQDPHTAIATLKSYDIPPGMPPEDQEAYLLDLQEMRLPQIQAIEQYIAEQNLDQKIGYLRQAVGIDGTHSIIDIPNTSALTALPNPELIQVWGSIRPAIADVQQSWQVLEKFVPQRFSAIYFTATDDNDSAIRVFIGISGD